MFFKSRFELHLFVFELHDVFLPLDVGQVLPHDADRLADLPQHRLGVLGLDGIPHLLGVPLVWKKRPLRRFRWFWDTIRAL